MNNWYNGKDSSNRVIAWFSGGIASMVACHLTLQKYDNVLIAYCDTGMEHPETFRFMEDFVSLTGVEVEIFDSPYFNTPEEVWRKYGAFSSGAGAPCSTHLKRRVRTNQIQNIEKDYCQVFGFDYCTREIARADNLLKNDAEINPKFPLIEKRITRQDLFLYAKQIGITPPSIYASFKNNNCIGAEDSPQGGCVKGGMGYWKHIQKVYPHKFEYMANLEHEISEKFNRPVTICRSSKKMPIFLKRYAGFSNIPEISEYGGRYKIETIECTSFCDTENK